MENVESTKKIEVNTSKETGQPVTQTPAITLSKTLVPIAGAAGQKTQSTLKSKVESFIQCKETTAKVFNSAFDNIEKKFNAESFKAYVKIQDDCVTLAESLIQDKNPKLKKYKSAILFTKGRIMSEKHALADQMKKHDGADGITANQSMVLSIIRGNELTEWETAANAESRRDAGQKQGMTPGTVIFLTVVIMLAVMKRYKVTPDSVRLYFARKKEKNNTFFEKTDDNEKK